MVGRGDGAGSRGSCWGLWSAGGYSSAAHGGIPGIGAALIITENYIQARDLGVLLSVLRGWLVCLLLGWREI